MRKGELQLAALVGADGLVLDELKKFQPDTFPDLNEDDVRRQLFATLSAADCTEEEIGFFDDGVFGIVSSLEFGWQPQEDPGEWRGVGRVLSSVGRSAELESLAAQYLAASLQGLGMHPLRWVPIASAAQGITINAMLDHFVRERGQVDVDGRPYVIIATGLDSSDAPRSSMKHVAELYNSTGWQSLAGAVSNQKDRALSGDPDVLPFITVASHETLHFIDNGTIRRGGQMVSAEGAYRAERSLGLARPAGWGRYTAQMGKVDSSDGLTGQAAK